MKKDKYVLTQCDGCGKFHDKLTNKDELCDDCILKAVSIKI